MKKILFLIIILIALGGCKDEWSFGPGPHKQLTLSFDIKGLKDTLRAYKDTIVISSYLKQPLTILNNAKGWNGAEESLQLPEDTKPNFLFFICLLKLVSPNQYRIDYRTDSSMVETIEKGKRNNVLYQSFYTTEDAIEYRVKYVPIKPGLYIGKFEPGEINNKDLFLATRPYINNKEKNHHLVSLEMQNTAGVIRTLIDKNATFAFYVK
jgi:hypothetical protein